MSRMKERQVENVRVDEVANVSDSVVHVHPAHQPTITEVSWRALSGVERPLVPRSIRKPDLNTRGRSVQINLESGGAGRRGRGWCGRSRGATGCRLRGGWTRRRASESVTLTREWAWRRSCVFFRNAMSDTELYWLTHLHVQLLWRSVSVSGLGKKTRYPKLLTQS